MRIARRFLLLFALVVLPGASESAEVIFVRSTVDSPAAQETLESAARFYGLSVRVVTNPGATNKGEGLGAAIASNQTVALVMTPRALGETHRDQLLRTVASHLPGKLPLLIVGTPSEMSPEILKEWSGGVLTGCSRIEAKRELAYRVGPRTNMTGALASIAIQTGKTSISVFAVSEPSEAEDIIRVQSAEDGTMAPVFTATTIRGQKIFWDCTGSAEAAISPVLGDTTATELRFAEIAPVLMFLKWAGGKYAWHMYRHYANLTIDDPSLREPYGFLNYAGLLNQMDKHHFHSTIAFIPWNYDRSDPSVIAVIRSRPDRFSIAIHGNNHDHKEFTDYNSKPLSVQIAALRQSLARMERFQALTGIPFDRVMVFPHSIAPEQTIRALKNYNYLATVNSNNVPMGSTNPSDPNFGLRSFTTIFAGLTSISRVSVDAGFSREYVAIQAFLENPLLFYCHHEFFERGIDAFNAVAEWVNAQESDTRWSGLGEVVRHLYLMRLRPDSDYDVATFGPDIQLENPSDGPAVFHIQRLEPDQAQLDSIVVDGYPLSFHWKDGTVRFEVPMRAGESREIMVRYKQTVSAATVSAAKNSLRVYLLRMGSEFRDEVLYKVPPGRALIHAYYGQWPGKLTIGAAGVLVGVVSGLCFLTLKRRWSANAK